MYIHTMCIEGVHGSYGSLIRDMAAVSETPFVSYFTMWPVLVQHSRNVHRRKINNQSGTFSNVNKDKIGVSSVRFEEHSSRALAGM